MELFLAFVPLSVIAHAAYFLNATAFLLRDILWLRAVAVCSSLLNITFKLLLFQETGASALLIDVSWHCVFTVINLIHITILIKEILGVKFTEDQKIAFKEVFSNFTPVDFHKFIKKSKFEKLKKGTVLAQEDKSIEQLTLIFDGDAEVIKHGDVITHLKQYAFVGEMAFTTGEKASATVTLAKDTKVFLWDFEDLKKLLRRNTNMRIAFQGSVGVDMAHKLGLQ